VNEATIEELRVRLDEERGNLISQLTEMGVDPETGQPNQVDFEQGGFADSGQSTAEKARVLSIAEGLLETLKEVEAALERVKAGAYGKCETCGSPIGDDRLDARPFARQCMNCKRRAS
jgi:RNA polymerase-binding protein DksA